MCLLIGPPDATHRQNKQTLQDGGGRDAQEFSHMLRLAFQDILYQQREGIKNGYNAFLGDLIISNVRFTSYFFMVIAQLKKVVSFHRAIA